jgi:hypothetical protein
VVSITLLIFFQVGQSDHQVVAGSGVTMSVDAIAEEEDEEDSENPDSNKLESEKHDEDSKPTDRKLFKAPSHDLAPLTSSSPSYTWRIDLTKTEQANNIYFSILNLSCITGVSTFKKVVF